MNKNFLASKNTDLKALEKKQKREETAWYLINSINKTKSSWLKCELLKNLYFYLDFHFVKDELMKIYKTSNSNEVKSLIKGLHDGNLDLTDLIESAKENEKLFNENAISREIFEQEIIDDTETIKKGKLETVDIGLLKLKFSHN